MEALRIPYRGQNDSLGLYLNILLPGTEAVLRHSPLSLTCFHSVLCWLDYLAFCLENGFRCFPLLGQTQGLSKKWFLWAAFPEPLVWYVFFSLETFESVFLFLPTSKRLQSDLISRQKSLCWGLSATHKTPTITLLIVFMWIKQYVMLIVHIHVCIYM